jgi:hypothetical protein
MRTAGCSPRSDSGGADEEDDEEEEEEGCIVRLITC